MFSIRVLIGALAFLGAAAWSGATEAARVSGVSIERVAADAGQGAFRIQFPAMAGLRYRLRESEDLVAWRETGRSVAGNGETQAFAVEAGGGARFFEVAASLDDSILSGITGIEYPLHVYTPPGYESSGKSYPIIYATDGQWYATGYAEAIRARGKEVILVAIEQGPGDRRAVDYTLPGAGTYLRFLKEELMPAVESVYRVDADQRALSGASYGGLFVGLALLMDDPEKPLFSKYLSFDGSFWRGEATINAMETARYNASHAMRVTLFLSSATLQQNNDLPVSRFRARLAGRGYEGLTIIRRSYAVHHNDVGQPSFEEALDLLY